MKMSMKTLILKNFTFLQEGYIGHHAFKKNGDGKFIYFQDEEVYKKHVAVVEELKNFDNFLTENFGENALHKIFGLDQDFNSAKILMGFNEYKWDNGILEYHSGFRECHLDEEKVFSFMIIHSAFEYFHISIKLSKEGRLKIYLNEIRKDPKRREKKVFFKVVDRMLLFIFRRTDLFDRIDLVASRHSTNTKDKFIGYFYWPELGFETSEIIEVEGLPKTFQHFLEEDFKKWREVGDTIHMYCDKKLYENYTVSFFEDVRGLIW